MMTFTCAAETVAKARAARIANTTLASAGNRTSMVLNITEAANSRMAIWKVARELAGRAMSDFCQNRTLILNERSRRRRRTLRVQRTAGVYGDHRSSRFGSIVVTRKNPMTDLRKTMLEEL